MEPRDIAGLIYNCRLFEEDEGWLSFIFRSASKEPDPQDLGRKKEALVELQGHFKAKLEKILRATKAGQETPILEIPGTTIFTAYPSKDRFLLDLKDDDKEADPLKKEKARLDLRFVDLVRILGLKPGRFKKCLECKRIFYQFTFKEKIYCSSQCSSAYRQSKFQQKLAHRDVKEGNVIEEGREVVDELKNKRSSMDGDS
jgi:hypothetical protein